MSSGPILETPRLVLRPHRLDDYEACCRLTGDPEAVRMIYRQPMSREDTWHRLLRFAGHWAMLGYGMLIVEERSSGRVIGEVGIADFHRGIGADFDLWPEAAWMMASDVHGYGYATEAASAVIEWMDAAFAPDHMVCIIDPENAASLRVAEKLGFHAFSQAEYKGKTVKTLRRSAAQDR